MKPLPRILRMCLILVFVMVTCAAAGNGYHGRSYHRHQHYPHYDHHTYRSYSYPDHLWVYPGLGLLSGIMAGTIINGIPWQRTVIYDEPWRSVVYEQPRRAIVYRTPPRAVLRPPAQIFTILPRETSHRQELALSRVETTPQLLNIRAVPDPDADITGELQQGSLVRVIDAAPDWLYIKTDSGHYGWIMLQYTRPVDKPAG